MKEREKERDERKRGKKKGMKEREGGRKDGVVNTYVSKVYVWVMSVIDYG